ncbi:uncharacterized protein LOC132599637 [Lycium barbarum]|uniref:uncharacterized protein LOC132599637 n=1 Tax=Lycium barbarum TaxID=112863 RepID=UPI00293E2D97|nr:uncharacterized protein LOC132599637 [Lycium barbarum]
MTIFMTSNIAESMSSTNKFARELLVRRLLEFLTKLMTQWSYENRKHATKSTKLGKMYNKKLKKNMIASQNMTAIPSTDQLYTVVEGKRINIVDLGEETCSCKRFQMNELPCSHAWAVIKHNGMDPIQFCSFYYKKDYPMKTWEIPVNPIPDETTWVVPREVMKNMVLPPEGKRSAGRPKIKRYKPASETDNNNNNNKKRRAKLSCGWCGQAGHNRKTCKNIPKNLV